MNSTYSFTDHATMRGEQRNVSESEVQYVLRHGASTHRAGAQAYFLGRRNIPENDRRNQRVAQLVGTTVLVDVKTGAILTVYRNAQGLKDHRRKSKCNRRATA